METDQKAATSKETLEVSSFGDHETYADPLIGTTFATQYKILECIGSGLKGRVYKAEHVYLNRPVALKILSIQSACDRESLTRFQHEARVMSRMNHPNIVGLQQFGVDVEGIPYLVTDFENATSFSDLIQKMGRVNSELVLDLGIQATLGIAYAHRKGLLHRDLKPGNMLVRQEPDGSWVLKLIDFGLAKVVDDEQSVTGTGMVVGTPRYMSPEQCDGRELDGRTDVYSLGCTLYEALMGHSPFDGSSDVELAYKHAHELVPALSADVYPALQRVVLKALSKKPEDRYATVLDMHDALVYAAANPADDFVQRARVGYRRLLDWRVDNKTKALVLFGFMTFMAVCSGILASFYTTMLSQYVGLDAEAFPVQSSNQGWYQRSLWAEEDEAKGDFKKAAEEYEQALQDARHSEGRHRAERINFALESLKRVYSQLKKPLRLAEIEKEMSVNSLESKAK